MSREKTVPLQGAVLLVADAKDVKVDESATSANGRTVTRIRSSDADVALEQKDRSTKKLRYSLSETSERTRDIDGKPLQRQKRATLIAWDETGNPTASLTTGYFSVIAQPLTKDCGDTCGATATTRVLSAEGIWLPYEGKSATLTYGGVGDNAKLTGLVISQ